MSMNVSVTAIQNAMAQVDRSAVRISAGIMNENLPRNMVNMMFSEKQVRVEVTAVRTQDEMLGSILDIKT